MSFTPQNLGQRLAATGKSVEDYLTDKAVGLATTLNTIGNNAKITVDAALDSVEGAISNIESVTKDPVTLIKPELLAGFSPNLPGILGTLGLRAGPPFPNELRDFSSFNYVITLGVLNNFEINFPDITYRRRDPQTIICRSGGGKSIQASTVYETNGQVEYYIDDLNVNSILGSNPKTGQTNAVGIDFKITEPYSMGLFLQTLQIAAVTAGHKNYLQAPYIISIDFKGWDNAGRPINKPNLRRFVPIKIVDMDFSVNEGGSQYQVQAIPWHEQAFTDQVQSLKSDIRMTGATVQELLQTSGFSLAANFNQREQEKKKKKEVITPDEYVVLFPKTRASADEGLLATADDDEGATSSPQRELTDEQKQSIYDSVTGTQNGQMPADFDAELSKLLGIVVKRSAIGESIREFAENADNVNVIGQSKLVESYLDGGKQPFGRPKFTEDEKSPGVFKRGNIQISNNGRVLTFKSGTKIQDIIEEVILLSDYGKSIVDAVPDENGMVPWFKIEADCYNITDYEQMDQTGTFPKVYVYRVVEYKAHVSHYTSPTKAGVGYENLRKQACKEYDYIYSGKNDDILEFDIKFDAAFFTAIQSGVNNFGKEASEQDKVAGDDTNVDFKTSEGSTDNLSSSGNATLVNDNNPTTGKEGGGGPVNTRVQIARDFNDALVHSNVDLLSVTMKIMGDPYYVSDSGMGNYSAAPTPLINLTKDGTMDYQSSEVDIQLNFRTPLDLGGDGWMDFPGLGTQPVGAFSGLYRVLYVYSQFYNGEFTQEMKCIRKRNQTGYDTKSEATTTDNSAKVENTEGSSDGNTGGASEGNTVTEDGTIDQT